MKRTSLLLASVMLVGSVGLAFAQDAPPAGGAMASPGGGRMAACRDDMAKHCADKTGPDRRQCMQDNMSKLSDDCKAALAAGRPGGGGGGGGQ